MKYNGATIFRRQRSIRRANIQYLHTYVISNIILDIREENGHAAETLGSLVFNKYGRISSTATIVNTIEVCMKTAFVSRG